MTRRAHAGRATGVDMLDGASSWAVDCFGHRAGEVAARIVRALDEAHRTGTRTQEASAQHQRYAYGSTWISRFDRLVDHLSDLPGTEVVPVARTSYRLARVDGRLVVPLRLAHSVLDVPRRPQLSRPLLDLLGAAVPAPAPEPTLFDPDPPAPPAPTGAELRPVLVGVVGAADTDDLLAASWGLAGSLDEDGFVGWDPEPLPIPGAGPPIPALRSEATAPRRPRAP